MKTCIVCGNQMPDDASVCSRCGFPAEQRYFLSERHYRAWIQETVEPARLNWQRQELERQRRELEMQKRLFAEQKRQFEEEKRLFAERRFQTDYVRFSKEQLALAAKIGFDLNLFENLPMTSREDILTWLNNNNYLYEESGIGNSWELRIRAKEGWALVKYQAQSVGWQPEYTMTYHYHENYLSDSLEETVNQLMNELHRKGSHFYYDNAGTYDVSKLSAERSVYRKAEQSEIDEQTDQIIRMLNEMPKIEEKQETLHWIEENNDSYKDHPEDGWCRVDLGIWDGAYRYEKWWLFEIHSGNPEQYYRAICEKLKNAGYEEEKEFSRDSRQITDYTLSGKMRVKTIYDLGLHYAAVTCMPE